MKNLFHFSLCLVLALAILSSCQKETPVSPQKELARTDVLNQINQKQVYNDLDEFYQLNPKIELAINFSEFVQLNESIQRVIFERLPIEKKLDFWKEKFKRDIKNQTISTEAKDLMKTFLSEVNLETFESMDKLAQFGRHIETLTEKEQQYFQWFTSQTLADQTNSFRLRRCNAYSCLSCWAYGASCENWCNTTSSGCWWFGSKPCKKRCNTLW